MNLNTDFIVPLTKIKAKGIIDINVKHKIIKLLVNCIGENQGILTLVIFFGGGGVVFVIYKTKFMIHKKDTDKWDLLN